MGNYEMNDSSLERPGLLKDVKIVLVGPAKCGKTALVQRFVNDTFFNTYTPTGFEKYSAKRKIGEFSVEYSIWDTSGSGAYDTVRPLAYQDANIFLLCFNIGDSESLALAVNKWFPEVRSHCPTTPIVLCGCLADLRDNTEMVSYLSHVQTIPITYDQALLAAQHISATVYVETTSVYSNKTVPDAFDVAAEVALGLHNKKNFTKKKKLTGSQSPILVKNNKTIIKNEIKGKAKNCCIM